MSDVQITALVERMRGEYTEMPGLSLTVPQAGRLWGVDCAATRVLLEALVAQKFLTETNAGAFVRRGRETEPGNW